TNIMFKYLQIEWMKIKHYRVFQVFSILYLLGILLIIYIFYKVYLSFIAELQRAMTGANTEARDILGLFSSTNLPYTVCFWTSFLLYLPGMFFINLFIIDVYFKSYSHYIFF